MTRRTPRRACALLQSLWALGACLSLGACSTPAFALEDEGMFPYSDIPKEEIKKRYGFKPTKEWLEHLRLSCVRVAGMGSGSLVSPDGLVMTNQHIAQSCAQANSTVEKNYVKEGFRAKSMASELKCPGTELHVLIWMRDLTIEAAAAVKEGMSEAEALAARRAKAQEIQEDQKNPRQGIKSPDMQEHFTELVEFYNGAQIWLYGYKRHADVRLVFIPELSAGFFGGDGDNFGYPRFAFDMAFFRVYEDAKPYQPKHYLEWSPAGAKEGQLVFTSGHPGSTERLRTLAQLEFARDNDVTALFDGLSASRKALKEYGNLSPEKAFEVQETFYSVENSLKAYAGILEGLKDPKFMAKKAAEENAFREAVMKDPKLKAEYGDLWDKIAELKKSQVENFKHRAYRGLRGTRYPTSSLADRAQLLARYADQERLPEEERFPEFKEGARGAVLTTLLSPLPFSAELEEKLLAASLELAAKALGQDDPFIKEAFNGRTPAEAAKEAVSKTRLADEKFRKDMISGGWKAVEASDDPLLRLARAAEPYYRQARWWFGRNAAPAEQALLAKLGRAWLAVRGEKAYPDATFTLRLSYGKVAGYEELTRRVPSKTTFYGLFDRAASFDEKDPFKLPETISKNKGKAELSTPLNFVTTNDITGGNSGSPMVDQEGRVVGLIFDGNIYNLPGDYLYTDDQARAVSVHSAGILEALSKFYDMPALASELAGRSLKRLAAEEEPKPGEGRKTGK